MKWADGIIRLCALSYLPKMNQGSINKQCSKVFKTWLSSGHRIISSYFKALGLFNAYSVAAKKPRHKMG